MSKHYDKIKTILLDQLGPELESIDPGATLVDLGADSLDHVELVMAVEEEFDIDIHDEEAEKWVTVADILAYLDDKV
jgi:acyl carrier protein